MLADRLKLSIVVLNYNRLTDTRLTMGHLRSIVGDRRDVEVLAVDNGSTDGTRAFLKTQADWARIFLLENNIGIGGLNRGFRHADGDYIMVLDDDSHPRDSVTIDRIIDRLDRSPRVGVVACRIQYPDGKVFRTWHLPDTDRPGLSMAFVGCGFAIRRDLFERIGWFPERFFLYQNEIETAIRVLRSGFEIQYEPSCRVIHRESASGRTTWRQVYYPTRNTIWIVRRYFNLRDAVWMIASRLAFGLIRALQTGQIVTFFQAAKAGLSEPIDPEPLPESLSKRLRTFKAHNNLICHLMGEFRFD
ncbi:MAG: glycosyltransferase [Deltaproteobacteria bacterium]|nr:MAG: glycosyltransferase [Deltaproteobacteria bacterium]